MKTSQIDQYVEDNIDHIIKERDMRKRVYHYTSLSTLFKIMEGIENGCFIFHAGSVYSMNDKQEMLIGYNAIRKYLPIVEDKLQIPKQERLSNLINGKSKNKTIKGKFGEWLINDDTTNFVVSFSASPNILPMWALYGDRGTGVCLEFSPYEIENYYKEEGKEKTVRIMECVYKKDDINERIISEIEIVYRLFSKLNDTEKKEQLVKAKYLAIMCGITGAFVKHQAFEYEQEFRLNFFIHKDQWLFDKTQYGNHLVYAKVPIPTYALTDVIIGPAANYDEAKNPLILALRAKGIVIVPQRSEIPFRLY